MLLNKRILYSSFQGKRKLRVITTSNFGSCLSSSVRKENKTSKPPMTSEVRSGETAQETVSACLFCKWRGGEIKSLAHLPKQPVPVSVTSMGLQHPTLQPLTPEVGLETIVSPNASGLSRRSSHTWQLSSSRVRKIREGAGISGWPQRYCKAPLCWDSKAVHRPPAKLAAQEPCTVISLVLSPVATSLRAAASCSEPFLVFR